MDDKKMKKDLLKNLKKMLREDMREDMKESLKGKEMMKAELYADSPKSMKEGADKLEELMEMYTSDDMSEDNMMSRMMEKLKKKDMDEDEYKCGGMKHDYKEGGMKDEYRGGGVDYDYYEEGGMKDELSEEERQLIDEKIQDVHTDKLQVQDVIDELPEHLRSKFLEELERRGASEYPERGESDRERKLEKML